MRSKTQTPNKVAPEEATILEHLRAEMTTWKSFIIDQIYIIQKKSKYFIRKSANCDDSKIIIKSINYQIDFLKSDIKSKYAFIAIILDYHKNKTGNQNHPVIEEKTTLVTLMTITNTSFRTRKNRQIW